MIAEFEWSWNAGSFDEAFGGDGPPSELAEATYVRYNYGGYIPLQAYADIELQPGIEYLIELTTADGQVIFCQISDSIFFGFTLHIVAL